MASIGRLPATLLAMVGLSLTVAASGCGNADAKKPDAIYTVRGLVVSLPDPAKPQSDFLVQHEAIDRFTDGEGEVVGMGAMTMPFPLAPNVRTSELKVGDKVEITFPVWWDDGVPTWRVTRITPLPAETELRFGPANSPPSTPLDPESDPAE